MRPGHGSARTPIRPKPVNTSVTFSDSSSMSRALRGRARLLDHLDREAAFGPAGVFGDGPALPLADVLGQIGDDRRNPLGPQCTRSRTTSRPSCEAGSTSTVKLPPPAG